MHTTHGTFRSLLGISILALALGLASSQSGALTLDTKIGQANLGNSGDATETNALAMILGIPTANLTLDTKINSGINAMLDSASGFWFIDVAPDEPGYFLLKFGTGGTTAIADTFFFTNIGELSKLVFSNEQVNFLSGGDCGANNSSACNIGRLSHYTTFNETITPPPVLNVPEPASLLLLGAGLVGLGFSRRKPIST